LPGRFDIIRRAAVECKEREIRRPKLYEALDFLEKQLDEKSTWLVRRYRRELRWDRRTYQEKEELRDILRATTRGIQFACVKVIVRRLNELAIHLMASISWRMKSYDVHFSAHHPGLCGKFLPAG